MIMGTITKETPTIKTWPVTSDTHLRYLLRVSETKLQEIEASIDKQYSPYTITETKKDGTTKIRTIEPSTGDLKIIQSRIEKRILKTIPLPDYVYGGRKGKSNITNAKAHLGKTHKFCLDIKNFFPSVSSARVNRCLLAFGFHPNIAARLTRLMTYKGHVPQGAPTSTTITNLVFYYEVDCQIEKLINKSGVKYTRFVDDLNFSSQADFKSIATQVAKTVIASGYKISKNKTFYKKGKVEMTGAKVGNNVLGKTEKHKTKLADPTLSEKSRAGLLKYTEQLKK